MEPKIVYVSHGIANNFGETIEVNVNLKKYPELLEPIIRHELRHSSSIGFTKKDLLLDSEKLDLNYWQLTKFMFKHPKSFSQFFPFYINKGRFIYDINMCIVWGLMLSAIGLSTFFALT